ncbi:helix-turn-helix domain-containing protein [Streptomyces fodineus]|uniref:helix-turn-helix domain-containing protein n=1 Tax=Streptomyces fodineus TaxID=1904616 RepID=UPI001D04513D|nr:helix-turn-helix transcriptional regulator [Streptomyces fodineus]
MRDQGLDAALTGATTRGDVATSYPNARTDAIAGDDYSSRLSSDAAPTPSGTDCITLSATGSTPTPTSRTRVCSLCRCRLSRYNREDVCSGCARSWTVVPPPRPFVPPQVWARQDVRDALLDKDFGLLCQLVREYGHLRQEDIALLTGLSQAFLSMLEAGQRRLTNIDRIIVLLDGLNAPLDITGPMLRPG